MKAQLMFLAALLTAVSTVASVPDNKKYPICTVSHVRFGEREVAANMAHLPGLVFEGAIRMTMEQETAIDESGITFYSKVGRDQAGKRFTLAAKTIYSYEGERIFSRVEVFIYNRQGQRLPSVTCLVRNR